MICVWYPQLQPPAVHCACLCTTACTHVGLMSRLVMLHVWCVPSLTNLSTKTTFRPRFSTDPCFWKETEITWIEALAWRVCSTNPYLQFSSVLFVFGNDRSTSWPRPATTFPPWRRAGAEAFFCSNQKRGEKRDLQMNQPCSSRVNVRHQTPAFCASSPTRRRLVVNERRGVLASYR